MATSARPVEAETFLFLRASSGGGQEGDDRAVMGRGDAHQRALEDDIGGVVHLKQEEVFRLVCRHSLHGKALLGALDAAQVAAQELQVGKTGIGVCCGQGHAGIQTIMIAVVVAAAQSLQQQRLIHVHTCVQNRECAQVQASNVQQIAVLISAFLAASSTFPVASCCRIGYNFVDR